MCNNPYLIRSSRQNIYLATTIQFIFTFIWTDKVDSWNVDRFFSLSTTIQLKFTIIKIAKTICLTQTRIKQLVDSTVGLGLVIMDFIVTSQYRQRINDEVKKKHTHIYKLNINLFAVILYIRIHKHFQRIVCGHFNQSQFVMLERRKIKSCKQSTT